MNDIKRDERWENVTAVFLPCAQYDLDIDTLSNIELWIFRVEVVYNGAVFWHQIFVHEDVVTDFGLNEPEPSLIFDDIMNDLVANLDKRLDHYDKTGELDV